MQIVGIVAQRLLILYLYLTAYIDSLIRLIGIPALTVPAISNPDIFTFFLDRMISECYACYEFLKEMFA